MAAVKNNFIIFQASEDIISIRIDLIEPILEIYSPKILNGDVFFDIFLCDLDSI